MLTLGAQFKSLKSRLNRCTHSGYPVLNLAIFVDAFSKRPNFSRKFRLETSFILQTIAWSKNLSWGVFFSNFWNRNEILIWKKSETITFNLKSSWRSSHQNCLLARRVHRLKFWSPEDCARCFQQNSLFQITRHYSPLTGDFASGFVPLITVPR